MPNSIARCDVLRSNSPAIRDWSAVADRFGDCLPGVVVEFAT
jgi:hypothetical protein